MSHDLQVNKFLAWISVIVVLIALAFAAGVVTIVRPTMPMSIQDLSALGGSFGILSAIFTGLAFAGLLATIVLQREELQLNRQELKDTREEFKLQSQTFQRQRFEDSFYRLLSLYKDNLRELSVLNGDNPSERIRGIDALRYLISKLADALKAGKWSGLPAGEQEQLLYFFFLEKTVRGYFVNQRQARYVETLKSILVLIDEECIPESRKPLYWQILVSQLTAYEIKYVFYVALVAPDLQPVRDVMVRSRDFQDRFGTLSFPRGHLAAYERLWSIALPKREKPYASRLPADQVAEARREMRERRRAERRAARVSRGSPDSDFEDDEES